ncbi:Ureohydrolase [Aureobasidium pullulans]|nr:Ureohydrolase [Aureobasidium pullulans]THZ29854.1 Ureohydrolase [Aureobasidium pullulans]
MDAPTLQPKFLPSRNELGLVAVGFCGGQGKSGVDAAPMALIESGLVEQLREELEFNVHYDGEVHQYSDIMPKEDPDYRNMKNPRAVSAVTRKLSEQVYEHARQGRFVLTLGGDHSIAIGTISGTAKAIRERTGREMAVIWVDAHADINTPETSDSGNIHGMPVAFLTGLAKEDKEDCFGWIKDDQRVSVKKLVYIGLRDIDRGEKKILREHNIKAFSMHDIDRYGIGKVMDMALGWIGSDTPIHLSFDIDSLDPMWAPSTGTPVRGGLTLREGDFIAECVHETGSLVALDLVEVNPSLEAHGASETMLSVHLVSQKRENGCGRFSVGVGADIIKELRLKHSIRREIYAEAPLVRQNAYYQQYTNIAVVAGLAHLDPIYFGGRGLY